MKRHGTPQSRARCRRRRRRDQKRRRISAAASGASRFTTEGPAVPRRSTGSAGAEWIARIVEGSRSLQRSPCSQPADSLSVTSGSGAEPCDRTSASSLSANSPSILALTSPMTLRPNCATFPVMASSVDDGDGGAVAVGGGCRSDRGRGIALATCVTPLGQQHRSMLRVVLLDEIGRSPCTAR